jgi:hypothetical protein
VPEWSQRSLPNRRLILGIVLSGVFMRLPDTTIVTVAAPSTQASLNAGAAQPELAVYRRVGVFALIFLLVFLLPQVKPEGLPVAAA